MTVTFAYITLNNNLLLSNVYEDGWKLAPLDELNNYLRNNPGLLDHPYMCKEGLVSSIHGGTVQYAGNIMKHSNPLWLATKDFRGKIDFYYSQFEWPFQIQFHPQGYLNDFVIDRIKNGFVVPNFTRQIKKLQPNLAEAHEKYAWESQKQISKRIKYKPDLVAR